MESQAGQLFDALMAGTSAAEIQPLIEQLTNTERQTFLCVVCFMADNMQDNRHERTLQLRQVLANNCAFFTASVACYEACKGKAVPFSPLTSIG